MKTLLIINTSGKEIRAQVSDKATVTFGGLIPGAKTDGGANRTALRIYEAKVQVAVFTNVQEFRFIECVSVLEKRVQQAAKDIVVEEDGVRKARTLHVTTEEWVNPDAVKPQATETAKDVFNSLQLEVKNS